MPTKTVVTVTLLNNIIFNNKQPLACRQILYAWSGITQGIEDEQTATEQRKIAYKY